MKDVFTILNTMNNCQEKKALATIIEVNGSSYRKPGALMLYLKSGTQIGLLSGGCLEDDLALRAECVMQEKSSCSIVYDLQAKDDVGWGQGKGCNGKITVLVEAVDNLLQQHLLKAGHFLQQGSSVLHVKKLSKTDRVVEYLFLSQQGDHFGTWTSNIPASFYSFLQTKTKHTLLLEILGERYFLQLFRPQPRLIVFGAGPDVRPLADYASSIGFHVIVTDWRPALCHPRFFPKAAKIIVDFPSAFLHDFQFSPHDFVLLMTHHFQKDQEILRSLLHQQVRYLGVLGPRNRTYQLLEEQKIPEWFHSPLGLSIGAEGPEEIAISILAELIKEYRRKEPYDCWNLSCGRTKQENGMCETLSSLG
ncbi:XdhC family protein [Caldalkalibacillus mannanilyticus]|uniref:XdhC family protein n=1 Tax=Caldalkalibacillus mannanilyticus TaxID=1418 RepID=UPI00046B0852|nr:XdhC family protein [Caldalkalibacillus mannanilyticus]